MLSLKDLQVTDKLSKISDKLIEANDAFAATAEARDIARRRLDEANKALFELEYTYNNTTVPTAINSYLEKMKETAERFKITKSSLEEAALSDPAVQTAAKQIRMLKTAAMDLKSEYNELDSRADVLRVTLETLSNIAKTEGLRKKITHGFTRIDAGDYLKDQ